MSGNHVDIVQMCLHWKKVLTAKGNIKVFRLKKDAGSNFLLLFTYNFSQLSNQEKTPKKNNNNTTKTKITQSKITCGFSLGI